MFSNMNMRSSAGRLLWILLPALTGVAQTRELLPRLGCPSVCKMGAVRVPAALFCFDILRLFDERDEAVSSCVFLQFMGNKVWGLFCAAGSSVRVIFFLEVLLGISVFGLFNGLQLESVSHIYLTALIFTVLQSMESFSSSKPVDRTGPDDMEILSEER